MTKKYSLINEYKRSLRKSVKRKQLKESTMKVYLGAADRILGDLISVLPKKNIGAIIKKTDPKISKKYYEIILGVVADLKKIVKMRKR